MSSPAPFHPSQILCIDHSGASLYAEVIQLAEARPLCWVRPFALVTVPDEVSEAAQEDDTQFGGEYEAREILDLRGGADLLLPIRVFRVALDVEVIPLLSILSEPKNQYGSDRTAQESLQSFTRNLWRAHPEMFQLDG